MPWAVDELPEAVLAVRHFPAPAFTLSLAVVGLAACQQHIESCEGAVDPVALASLDRPLAGMDSEPMDVWARLATVHEGQLVSPKGMQQPVTIVFSSDATEGLLHSYLGECPIVESLEFDARIEVAPALPDGTPDLEHPWIVAEGPHYVFPGSMTENLEVWPVTLSDAALHQLASPFSGGGAPGLGCWRRPCVRGTRDRRRAVLGVRRSRRARQPGRSQRRRR